MKDYQNIYLKRAKIIGAILAFVPFVRMIALTGSVARGEATEKSDIDFFIITKSGRIWTCRALVTIIVQLSGYRRYGSRVAGRICLNRYQTTGNLDIKPRNEYHARDYSQITPLIDIDKTYNRYLKTNSWTKNFGFRLKRKTAINSVILTNFCRTIGEYILSGSFGDWLESRSKSYQGRRIALDIRTITAPKGKIRFTDNELCFHPSKKSLDSR